MKTLINFEKKFTIQEIKEGESIENAQQRHFFIGKVDVRGQKESLIVSGNKRHLLVYSEKQVEAVKVLKSGIKFLKNRV